MRGAQRVFLFHDRYKKVIFISWEGSEWREVPKGLFYLMTGAQRVVFISWEVSECREVPFWGFFLFPERCQRVALGLHRRRSCSLGSRAGCWLKIAPSSGLCWRSYLGKSWGLSGGRAACSAKDTPWRSKFGWDPSQLGCFARYSLFMGLCLCWHNQKKILGGVLTSRSVVCTKQKGIPAGNWSKSLNVHQERN